MASISQLFTIRTTEPVKITRSQDGILEGETYVSYGTRLCGKVTASINALSAYLPKIFNEEKQRQYNDAELQEELSNRRRNDINNLSQKIAREKAAIEHLESEIEEDRRKIQDTHEKLVEAKAKNGEVNRLTNVKLIIGITILVFLTVYLFIFYSSTFYSAFFRVIDGNINVAQAMFDPQAFSQSYLAGFGQLIFIICAPIIFMGLGYSLHYFAVQESWTKYIKSAAVIVVTAAFDFILAYLIAEKMYNYIISITPGDFPPFDFNLAIRDLNLWAVIFCGFITYMIWGVVFDMTITAYGELRSNEKEINVLNSRIESLNTAINDKKNKIIDCRGCIKANEQEIDSLTKMLESTKQFNPHIIKTALNDFFAGWLTMMNALGRSSIEQQNAHEIFDTTTKNLFNE